MIDDVDNDFAKTLSPLRFKILITYQLSSRIPSIPVNVILNLAENRCQDPRTLTADPPLSQGQGKEYIYKIGDPPLVINFREIYSSVGCVQ
jgi:hypothetical protein